MNSRYILLCTALLLFYCNPPLPENSDILFVNWFISADENISQALLASKPSPQQLDSLAGLVRSKKIKPGDHATKVIDQSGKEYVLGFSVPENVDDNSLYPLLVYLHGGIGTARNDKGAHAFDMFRFLADTVDLFLASPSANRECAWWTPEGLSRILQTVRYMTLHFPIDPERIFLAGVSDGAAGCYAAANTIWGPFAGFITVSGFGGILPRLGMELHPSNIMQRPVYNIHAGGDHLYPVATVEKFLDWLEEQGCRVKRKIYPEEKHGFDYREKEKETITDLINTWRKPQRNTVSWIMTEKVPNLPDNLLSWSICGNSGRSQAGLLCYWKKDTLQIRSKGLCSIAMLSSAGPTGDLFYKTEDGTVKPLKFREPDTENYFSLMQHFCTPVVPKVEIVTIVIK